MSRTRGHFRTGSGRHGAKSPWARSAIGVRAVRFGAGVYSMRWPWSEVMTTVRPAFFAAGNSAQMVMVSRFPVKFRRDPVVQSVVGRQFSTAATQGLISGVGDRIARAGGQGLAALGFASRSRL